MKFLLFTLLTTLIAQAQAEDFSQGTKCLDEIAKTYNNEWKSGHAPYYFHKESKAHYIFLRSGSEPNYEPGFFRINAKGATYCPFVNNTNAFMDKISIQYKQDQFMLTRKEPSDKSITGKFFPSIENSAECKKVPVDVANKRMQKQIGTLLEKAISEEIVTAKEASQKWTKVCKKFYNEQTNGIGQDFNAIIANTKIQTYDIPTTTSGAKSDREPAVVPTEQ